MYYCLSLIMFRKLVVCLLSLQIYSEYSVGFDRAQLAYAKWLEKKKSFSDLIKKTEVSDSLALVIVL